MASALALPALTNIVSPASLAALTMTSCSLGGKRLELLLVDHEDGRCPDVIRDGEALGHLVELGVGHAVVIGLDTVDRLLLQRRVDLRPGHRHRIAAIGSDGAHVERIFDDADLLALQIVGLGNVEADGQEAAHIPYAPRQRLDALGLEQREHLGPDRPIQHFPGLLARLPDERQLGDREGWLDGGDDARASHGHVEAAQGAPGRPSPARRRADCSGKIWTSISPFESLSATSFSFDEPCPAIACRVVTCPMRRLVLVCAMAVPSNVIVIVPTTNAATALILITCLPKSRAIECPIRHSAPLDAKQARRWPTRRSRKHFLETLLEATTAHDIGAFYCHCWARTAALTSRMRDGHQWPD